MRDHKFIDSVVNALMSYNHQDYINDINELITLNQFNDAITLELTSICNILDGYLNTMHVNNNNTAYLVTYKHNLKTHIHNIMRQNNGYECCKKLLCENN